MEVELVIAKGTKAGRVIPLDVPKFFIGRAPKCHLRPSSGMVSRHHCALLNTQHAVTVYDFGSTNGTLVNGERIEGQRELEDGDRLTVGPLDFDVRIQKTSNTKAPIEPAEDSSDDGSKIVSEEEKEERRRKGAIVGVSKAAQEKRLTETTRDAAADALKKFFS